ncbi:MAG: hypothetical protein PF636_07045 [Actinomycetota bacterium]|nr:hypothetical protein [Actinomycetota bacterium]
MSAEDHHEITQVLLEIYGDAKFAFAYEAGPSRLAVFTGLAAAEYDNLVLAAENRTQEVAPVELEGVGDEAVLFSGKVIFKTDEDCGVISGIPRVDADGEEFMTLTPDELESLARIAAPRM